MFRRNYMTTVEVTCKDKSYPWVLEWITKRGARNTQHLSVDTEFAASEGGKISTKYNFVPSPGTHFMRHKGTWIRVENGRSQTNAYAASRWKRTFPPTATTTQQTATTKD